VSVSDQQPALEAKGIVKRFGALTALAGVDFALREGEVHALVGENGAGKSTLMSILYGVQQPDAGSLLMRGSPIVLPTCAAAMRAGIGMVFQHFLLVERFTVAQNVLLGREPASGGMLDARAAVAAVHDIAQRYRFGLDASALVEDLGVGARQQVELLKVLERDARVIILDEPTASLSPVEARSLLDVVRRLRAEGRAIAFVSHKLREVLEIADRITVLRGGVFAGSLLPSEADPSTLATMMVGRLVDLDARAPRATAVGEPVLEVRELRVARDNRVTAVDRMSLRVNAREIVGVAGVEGNGQLEFAEALYGLRRATEGTIALNGRDITAASTTSRRDAGMRYVPADRLREGLVLEFDAPENALLGDQRRSRSPLLDLAGARARADAIAKAYGLAGYRQSAPVSTYSGGMQQKLIAGRELTDGAKAVIAYTPTRGVDVGAAQLIHDRLREVRDRGAAVILVSYDLDEIRALADRIVVFCNGVIVGELMPEAASDDALGRLMGGVAAHA
jgi:general nucleoside transport system ATP-binding protein